MDFGLLWGKVAFDFRLLGFPGSDDETRSGCKMDKIIVERLGVPHPDYGACSRQVLGLAYPAHPEFSSIPEAF